MSTDDNFEEFVIFPVELLEEHRDVLILHAYEDREHAIKLENAINSTLIEIYGRRLSGKAVLFEDAVPYDRSQVESLDSALQFHTLVMVIVTSALLQTDDVALHRSHAALWSSICQSSRKNTFIPVYLTRADQLSLKTPFQYDVVTPVFLDEIPNETTMPGLLKFHVGKRLQRARSQEEERKLFYSRQNSQLSEAGSEARTHSLPLNGSETTAEPSQNSLRNFMQFGEDLETTPKQLSQHNLGYVPQIDAVELPPLFNGLAVMENDESPDLQLYLNLRNDYPPDGSSGSSEEDMSLPAIISKAADDQENKDVTPSDAAAGTSQRLCDTQDGDAQSFLQRIGSVLESNRSLYLSLLGLVLCVFWTSIVSFQAGNSASPKN